MCCQIASPGRSIKIPRHHQTFAIEKIPRFDRNSPIMSSELFTNASKNNRWLLFVISQWFRLELNWFVYDASPIFQLSEFVWTLRSSVWVVFNNFPLIDATDRINISSNQKGFIFAASLYPLSFFANTPFNPTVQFKLFNKPTPRVMYKISVKISKQKL